VQAAFTHPHMVEALGHDVPRIFMWTFGAGTALAGLAGVIGGSAFVTEPGMAAAIGPIVFVIVVIGGLGSLPGAFIASMAIGFMQTFAVGLDFAVAGVSIAQAAPVLPFLAMVLVLLFRPSGLLGESLGLQHPRRESRIGAQKCGAGQDRDLMADRQASQASTVRAVRSSCARSTLALWHSCHSGTSVERSAPIARSEPLSAVITK
jgi:hypothetical protein